MEMEAPFDGLLFNVSVKMSKILLFHVTKPKNEVLSVIEIPPFILCLFLFY